MRTTLGECVHAVDRLGRSSRLLSGPPALARGEPVVPARDPLGLGAHSAVVPLDEASGATQADHALPQRQTFRLPVCLHATRVGERAHE